MKSNDIMKYIKYILTDELSLAIGPLAPEQFIREAGVDSVSLMALTVYLENQYNVECDEIFINYENDIRFQDLIDIVLKQVK